MAVRKREVLARPSVGVCFICLPLAFSLTTSWSEKADRMLLPFILHIKKTKLRNVINSHVFLTPKIRTASLNCPPDNCKSTPVPYK